MNLTKSMFSDPQNLMFSDESESPQKPKNKSCLPIRLPTIAKFRLSDDCIPIWEILDCDSSKATPE